MSLDVQHGPSTLTYTCDRCRAQHVRVATGSYELEPGWHWLALSKSEQYHHTERWLLCGTCSAHMTFELANMAGVDREAAAAENRKGTSRS